MSWWGGAISPSFGPSDLDPFEDYFSNATNESPAQLLGGMPSAGFLANEVELAENVRLGSQENPFGR